MYKKNSFNQSNFIFVLWKDPECNDVPRLSDFFQKFTVKTMLCVRDWDFYKTWDKTEYTAPAQEFQKYLTWLNFWVCDFMPLRDFMTSQNTSKSIGLSSKWRHKIKVTFTPCWHFRVQAEHQQSRKFSSGFLSRSPTFTFIFTTFKNFVMLSFTARRVAQAGVIGFRQFGTKGQAKNSTFQAIKVSYEIFGFLRFLSIFKNNTSNCKDW